MNRNNSSFYGGVGFSNTPAPTSTNSERGQKKNGEPIECSRDYNLECSEVNSLSILGRALAQLTLASSEASVTTMQNAHNLTDVLHAITDQDPTFHVNDFYVSVFSFDGLDADGRNLICQNQDGSGCCLAHGFDPSFVGLTWKEIIDRNGISAIDGTELHRKLADQSNTGSGWIKYSWSKNSITFEARSWPIRVRGYDGRSHYVVSEYLLTPLPPTCDSCPNNTECTSDAQEFCADKPDPPFRQQPAFIAVLIILSIGAPLTALVFWRQKRLNKAKLQKLDQEMKELATKMEQQMQGMYEVVHDMPVHSADDYRRKVGDGAGDSSKKRNTIAVWYWEEDDAHIGSHKSSMVLTGSRFVGYSREISGQIEHAYQLYVEGRGFEELRVDLTDKITSTETGGKISGTHTGSHYEVNFASMTQTNSSSKFVRSVQRKEIEIAINSEVAADLPPLPDDIDFTGEDREELLPTFTGQVIQVSKVHTGKQWLFGNVLYDPLLHDALKQQAQEAKSVDGLNSILLQALHHDRPTSGWFPRAVTKPADVKVMHKLLKTLGGEGMDTLSPPPTWDDSTEGRIEVQEGTTEYDEVTNFFMAALYGQRDLVKVKKVERIQNLPSWQSYAVKKQTMKTRDSKDMALRVNNKDPNLDAIERRWLFHGTDPDVIPKIVIQGFNRAFAGKNAVAYGKGVYFARDASCEQKILALLHESSRPSQPFACVTSFFLTSLFLCLRVSTIYAISQTAVMKRTREKIRTGIRKCFSVASLWATGAWVSTVG